MKKNLLKITFVLCIGIFIVGCANSQPAVNGGGNTYENLNAAYNRKNGTINRSMVVDTIIATTLYNHPEIIPVIGKSVTKGRTKTNVSATSNTVANGQYFSNGNSSFGQSQSLTTTKVHSKSTTKSVTTGIGISPNLDFYLK